MKNLMRLCVFVLLAALTAAAQTPYPPSPVDAREFSLWVLPMLTGTSATGAQSFTTRDAISTPTGHAMQPFSTNAAIIVGDGLEQETVTPSAVSDNPGLSTVTVTATFTKTHGPGTRVRSATVGLQEALNFQHLAAGGNVFVDKSWLAVGGTSGEIAAAVIATGVRLEDRTVATPAGSGTVTSITANAGLTASPNPIVNTGTIGIDPAADVVVGSLTTTGTGPDLFAVNANPSSPVNGNFWYTSDGVFKYYDGSTIQTIATPPLGQFITYGATGAPTNYEVLTAGSGVTLTPDAGAHTMTIASSGGGGSPGAPDKSVQFNSGGAFAGDANFTWDAAAFKLDITDTSGNGDVSIQNGRIATLNFDGGFYQNQVDTGASTFALTIDSQAFGTGANGQANGIAQTVESNSTSNSTTGFSSTVTSSNIGASTGAQFLWPNHQDWKQFIGLAPGIGGVTSSLTGFQAEAGSRPTPIYNGFYAYNNNANATTSIEFLAGDNGSTTPATGKWGFYQAGTTAKNHFDGAIEAPGLSPWVTALPDSGTEGQRTVLYNTTGADDIALNGEYLWHVDAWANPVFMPATPPSTAGSFNSPVWLAYLHGTTNVGGTHTYPGLHLAHITGNPLTLDFRSITVTGTLELNDVITSNAANAFDFTTATLSGDVTLKGLTGTAVTFQANNAIGGRLTLDSNAVLTTITATAPQITLSNLTGANLFAPLTYTGADGGLTFTGPFSTWDDIELDGTGSTITTVDWSTISPTASGSFFSFTNATSLTTVTIPVTPDWKFAEFTNDALSQASVDGIFCRMSVSTAPNVTIFTNGGTSSPPSVTGLQCAGSVVATATNLNFNHSADYAITAVNQGTKTFTIAGDHSADTRLNTAGNFIQVQGSTGNNGWYTVISATLSGGSTNIVVTQALASAVADGTIGN